MIAVIFVIVIYVIFEVVFKAMYLSSQEPSIEQGLLSAVSYLHGEFIEFCLSYWSLDKVGADMCVYILFLYFWANFLLVNLLGL